MQRAKVLRSIAEAWPGRPMMSLAERIENGLLCVYRQHKDRQGRAFVSTLVRDTPEKIVMYLELNAQAFTVLVAADGWIIPRDGRRITTLS